MLRGGHVWVTPDPEVAESKLSLTGMYSPHGDILQIRAMKPEAFRARTGSNINQWDGQTHHYIVIAVEGAVEDWAAYVGPDDRTLSWIRENGLKLRGFEAAKVFPLLNPERYRK